MQFTLALPAPRLADRVSRPVVASAIARLIAGGMADSKAELCRATGLSRTIVDSTVRSLMDSGLLRLSGSPASPGRGRPVDRLELDPGFGLVLVADCGASRAGIAVCDARQKVLAHRELEIHMKRGPESTLALLSRSFFEMLDDLGLASIPRTVVLGLPGPVDHRAGTVVRPPLMPGWDDYPIVAHLSRLLGATVVLENDVNLRALGEARVVPPKTGPIVYVKVGTGIGAGIVNADGTLLRGADGAAGDIGHIPITGADARCACGARGCLEAIASAGAIGRSLGLIGTEQEVAGTLAHLMSARDPETMGMVRMSADILGGVLVSLIHLINPERIVVGGMLSEGSDELLAGIRSSIYGRALPLATRDLQVVEPMLGGGSGIAGGLAVGLDLMLLHGTLSERLLAAQRSNMSGSAHAPTLKPSSHASKLGVQEKEGVT